MPVRLMALDDGADISLDQAMVVIGRHPQCHVRLDSLRISRRHCCMTTDHGAVLIRDLGSTNGIRINGERVDFGRLLEGDELSIAHIRYRLVSLTDQEATLRDEKISRLGREFPHTRSEHPLGRDQEFPISPLPGTAPEAGGHVPTFEPASASRNQVLPKLNANGERLQENALAAAVRELLPAGMADLCRIQVIVQMPDDPAGAEKLEACRPDSPH